MPTRLADKRRHPRRKLHIVMKYWELKDGKPVEPAIEAVSRDLSVGGVGFESKISISIGAELLSEIYLPGRKEPVVTHLKVVRVESVPGKEHYLIGAVLSETKLEDLHFIAASLEALNLYTLLDSALQEGASDIHLTVGRAPVVRVEGQIRFMKTKPIQDGEIKAMMYPLLSHAQIESLEEHKELDFAFSPRLDIRFRVNLHYQKGFLEAALRSVTAGTKSFAEIGVPVEIMEHLCRERSGLVLIAGKTGSGKSTTLTSMVDFINNNIGRVVITIEDPIEHIHVSKKSVIKQRELGSDTRSFAEALKHSLRQDPDVIVVGELRDSESMMCAVRAAETGHLIISTVHASDAVQALERVVTLFPPDEAKNICQRLSSCLLGVIFQILVPSKDEKQAMATELLVNNSEVRHMIYEGAFEKVGEAIRNSKSPNMYTLQDSLKKLHKNNLIEKSIVDEYSGAA